MRKKARQAVHRDEHARRLIARTAALGVAVCASLTQCADSERGSAGFLTAGAGGAARVAAAERWATSYSPVVAARFTVDLDGDGVEEIVVVRRPREATISPCHFEVAILSGRTREDVDAITVEGNVDFFPSVSIVTSGTRVTVTAERSADEGTSRHALVMFETRPRLRVLWEVEMPEGSRAAGLALCVDDGGSSGEGVVAHRYAEDRSRAPEDAPPPRRLEILDARDGAFLARYPFGEGDRGPMRVSDVDGDGHSDVLVLYTSWTRPEALLISGRDGSELRRVELDHEWTEVAGPIRPTPDLDGDGLPEFVIGHGTNLSSVSVVSLGTGAVLGSFSDRDRSFGLHLGAPATGASPLFVCSSPTRLVLTTPDGTRLDDIPVERPFTDVAYDEDGRPRALLFLDEHTISPWSHGGFDVHPGMFAVHDVSLANDAP